MKAEGRSSKETLFSSFILCLTLLACVPKPKQPEIIQVEPQSGPTYGRYPLFVIGNNFHPRALVTIGDQPVEDISLGQIFLVKVPPGPAGKADVAVTNPGNKKTILKGGFVYQIYPFIHKKGIQPSGGNSAGGKRVTIKGDGFDKGIIVRFANQRAEVKSINKNEIVVLAPPHPPDIVDVVVINPGGFSFVLEDAFSYYR